MKTTSLSVFTAALLASGLTGCDRDNVQVYHVATNDTVVPQAPAVAAATPAAPMTMSTDALPAPDNSGLPPLKYTLPEGWKEKKLTTMRVASFDIQADGKQADVSVVPMGGTAGGIAPNVNRWRGQVGLPAAAEDEIEKSAEKISVAGLPADLYDVAGTAPGSGDAQRIVAAVLNRDDTAWFFKMDGDAALVEKQKPAFVEFLKTLEFGGLPAPSTMDLSKLPPSHPAIPGLNSATASSTAAPTEPAGPVPTWDVPVGWQKGALTQFVIAKFLVQGDGGAMAAVNVSQLDGDGGGLAANVNRWRGQLGLATVTDDEIAKLPTIDAGGAKATVAEINGTDPRSNKPASLVGIVLPLNGQTWFYKLLGDSSVVAAQKDAFIKFVQSAKYP